MPNKILKEVIGAYLEILLEAFNSCLWEGRFFVDWKKQRLVLLRKGNKPLGDASSYRPICLLDTMGKLLEEMILQRLQGHMVGENGLSEIQFGFPKGRSTVDAVCTNRLPTQSQLQKHIMSVRSEFRYFGKNLTKINI